MNLILLISLLLIASFIDRWKNARVLCDGFWSKERFSVERKKDSTIAVRFVLRPLLSSLYSAFLLG